MKVCTDACVFGAYIEPAAARRILDIGTGTGLLALMLAQKSQARIDAVEIDADAADQARTNVERSIYADRVRVHHVSIQEFAAHDTPIKYDLICCNPPFFENCLRSVNQQRRMARHTDTLSFVELMGSVARLLAPGGRFFVHVPVEFEASFLGAATNVGLSFDQRVLLRHSRQVPPNRVFLRYVWGLSTVAEQDELVLRNDADTDYDPRVRAMLVPYYASLL